MAVLQSSGVARPCLVWRVYTGMEWSSSAPPGRSLTRFLRGFGIEELSQGTTTSSGPTTTARWNIFVWNWICRLGFLVCMEVFERGWRLSRTHSCSVYARRTDCMFRGLASEANSAITFGSILKYSLKSRIRCANMNIAQKYLSDRWWEGGALPFALVSQK